MPVTLDNIETKQSQAKKFLLKEKEYLDAVALFSTMLNDDSIISRISIDIPGASKPVTFTSDILPTVERGALIFYLKSYFEAQATALRQTIDSLFD